jgi:large conductance mechanosensitive channel
MLAEFKKFIMRGNVLELAIGIVIGAAFGRVVSSFVADVLTPPLGLLLGRVDFSNLFVTLTGPPQPSLAAAKAAGAATLNYGLFLQSVVDLLIVGLAIFLVIRQVNRIFPPPPPPPATTVDCPYCLSPVPLRAKRCAHCTSALEDLAPVRPA